jgi:hypothetical protein
LASLVLQPLPAVHRWQHPLKYSGLPDSALVSKGCASRTWGRVQFFWKPLGFRQTIVLWKFKVLGWAGGNQKLPAAEQKTSPLAVTGTVLIPFLKLHSLEQACNPLGSFLWSFRTSPSFPCMHSVPFSGSILGWLD